MPIVSGSIQCRSSAYTMTGARSGARWRSTSIAARSSDSMLPVESSLCAPVSSAGVTPASRRDTSARRGSSAGGTDVQSRTWASTALVNASNALLRRTGSPRSAITNAPDGVDDASASLTRRVLPMPASPPTRATRAPSPAPRTPASRCNSPSRPTIRFAAYGRDSTPDNLLVEVFPPAGVSPPTGVFTADRVRAPNGVRWSAGGSSRIPSGADAARRPGGTGQHVRCR